MKLLYFSYKKLYFYPRKIAKIEWTLVSGSSRGRKMLMDTVIIILNGKVAVNVFVIFTRNYRWSYFSHTGKDEDLGRFIVLAQPVRIAVDMVEGYYS